MSRVHPYIILVLYLLIIGPIHAEAASAQDLGYRGLIHPLSIMNSDGLESLSEKRMLASDKKAQKVPVNNIVKPAAGPFRSIFDDNTVVAYYGNPYGRFMGILGESSIENATAQLKKTTAEYDAVNGTDGAMPAYHLIYATVQPKGDINYLNDDKVLEYIQYGLKNGVIVVLDHQIGKYTVKEAMNRLLPWLIYPNVHIAIDPEWRTLIPGEEIGSIDSSELNNAMAMMQDYMVKNNINARRMLMVHQFNWKMIGNREKVNATPYDRIDLIHNADGWGSRDLKMGTWNFMTAATNMPLKGFKLFYKKSWRADNFDSPLWTPQEVLDLNPRPLFINYQ